MVIRAFPPLDQADETGLLAWGGDLDPQSLLLAYRNGIFPWPSSEKEIPLLWFSPPERGILFFDKFHVPERDRRFLKQKKWQCTRDQAFPEVIRLCAQVPRVTLQKVETDTWIHPVMIDAYIQFHRIGYAHSFEVWDQDKKLIGGLYGVRIDRYFAGESMFHLESGASKLALIEAVSFLKTQGLSWMDTQMCTPLIKRFGGQLVCRDDFMNLLQRSLLD